jgi:hypothetical protein
MSLIYSSDRALAASEIHSVLMIHRGAKAAMTVALQSPESVSALIPVYNAPLNAKLKSYSPKYVQDMQHVEREKVKQQSDANKIREDYEEVWKRLMYQIRSLD